MNKVTLFLIALLLPFAAATPQSMSFANPAQVVASGNVTTANVGGFIGFKLGNTQCVANNTPGGSWSGNFTLNIGAQCFLSFAGNYDLRIALFNAASVTQNYFTYVRVVDCASVVRIFTSASATFTGTTLKNWQWGAGASPVYVTPCPAGTMQIVFFR
jgi:hypothetical protein